MVARGNDLTNFFWPILYFVKNSILTYHQIPLWNNLFFSGTPLLPDPQAPIFYIPNIVFLIFKNIDTGFLVSIYFHIFAAGIGMYLLALKGFKFSKKVSLFCALIYIASPKLSGYIEAGHFGLITSWTYIPFAFLATILMARKPSFKGALFLSVTLAGIFYSHILIFGITAVATCILYFYLILIEERKPAKNIFFVVLSGLICFGFIAIAFLPQLAWQGQTTRSLLLNNPDVYPKWLSKIEFIKASVSPIFFGPKYIWDLDTEKTIAVGFFTLLLSFFGFIKLKRRNKLLTSFCLVLIILVSLNNSSPIYIFLIKMNWYILLRVATRFWFLAILIFVFLSGYGLTHLLKVKKIRFLLLVISTLAVIELLLTSWTKILKPILVDTNLAPKEVYEFLTKDKTMFRVLCVTRCLSQKEAAIYNLQLADGYGTLQQMNYYIQSEQITQSFYRFRYTLSIPPFEIFEYEKLQPYSPDLAAFNIKYVISNHFLKDKKLKLVKQIGEYSIYENEINKPRANYPIEIFTPNIIRINTSNYQGNKLILSEVYNSDWRAYLNGNISTKINHNTDQTREVNITDNTKFVTLTYLPGSFLIGLLITICTIILCLIKLFL